MWVSLNDGSSLNLKARKRAFSGTPAEFNEGALSTRLGGPFAVCLKFSHFVKWVAPSDLVEDPKSQTTSDSSRV